MKTLIINPAPQIGQIWKNKNGNQFVIYDIDVCNKNVYCQYLKSKEKFFCGFGWLDNENESYIFVKYTTIPLKKASENTMSEIWMCFASLNKTINDTYSHVYEYIPSSLKAELGKFKKELEKESKRRENFE